MCNSNPGPSVTIRNPTKEELLKHAITLCGAVQSLFIQVAHSDIENPELRRIAAQGTSAVTDMQTTIMAVLISGGSAS